MKDFLPLNAVELRGWLLQKPHAALIRVTTDGDVEEIKPTKSWAKIAATIAALEPDLVQCFDAGGKLLRATRFEADAAPPRKRPGSDAPTLPDVIAQDPQAALLTHFASLLHRAYEHSTQTAFEKMVELFERMNERSDSIEQRLERAEAHARRLRDDQVQDAFERAEEIASAAGQTGNDAFVNQMAEAFFSGKLNRAAKSNGAAKANGAGKAGAD